MPHKSLLLVSVLVNYQSDLVPVVEYYWRLPFSRLVREFIHEHFTVPVFQYRFQASVLLAAEAFLIALFEDANLCVIHAKRIKGRENGQSI